MKNLIIILLSLLPFTVSAQLLRSYGVVEIGATFPASTINGAKFAYRTTDSSYYRWVSGNTWVKVIEPSIIPDTLYLTEQIGTSYKVSGDTINLTPYLLKSDTTSMLVRYIERGDTASMLSNYPSTVGYGILKSSKTIRADTTSPNGLATRLFAKTLPTSIGSGQIAYSNGTNLVGNSNFTFSTTRPSILMGATASTSTATPALIDMGGTYSSSAGANPKLNLFSASGNVYGFGVSANSLDYIVTNPGVHNFFISGSNVARIANSGNFLLGTTTDVTGYNLNIAGTGAVKLSTGTDAQRPTNAFGLLRGNTTGNGIEFGNGSNWSYLLRSSLSGGVGLNTYVPYFGSDGYITASARLTYASDYLFTVKGTSYPTIQIQNDAGTIYGKLESAGPYGLFSLYAAGGTSGLSLSGQANSSNNYLHGAFQLGAITGRTSFLDVTPSQAGGDISGAGHFFRIRTSTFQNNVSPTSTTIASGSFSSFDGGTVSATSTGIVYTDFSTLRIAAAPTAGPNVTLSNPWSLRVVSGNTNLGTGYLYLPGQEIRFGPLSSIGNLNIRQYWGGGVNSSIQMGAANTVNTSYVNGGIFLGSRNNHYDGLALVVGNQNTIASPSAAIIFGANNVVNTMSGNHITVGSNNTNTAYTNGQVASIIIGDFNNTNGFYGGGLFGTNLKYYANKQLAFGGNSNSANFAINDVYFGYGVRNEFNSVNSNNGHGPNISINPSQAYAGTDQNGGNLNLNGGIGTSAGTPGDVNIATATALSTGTVYQTLTNRVIVKGTSGFVGIGGTPSYFLDLNSTNAIRLPSGTTAQRPTGALAILRGNTDNTSIEWYNGTRWASALESTFARGTATRVPFFDANGQVTDDPYFKWNTSTGILNAGNFDINIKPTGASGTRFVNIGNGTANIQSVNIGGASSGITGTSVGFNSSSGTNAVALGASATAGASATVFGFQASASQLGTAIGDIAVAGGTSGSLAIGRRAKTLANGQFVSGSGGNNASPITDVYFGTGIQRGNGNASDETDGAGGDYTINGSGARGSNQNGGNITIAGGKGTGTGTSGDIILSTSTLLGSGSTLQSLSQRALIKGNTGFFGIGTTSPTEQLHVNDDLRVGDSTRLTTTPAHTSITGLLTRDANGWVGSTSIGTGLSYSGGTLRATGAETWIKTELEAGRDVDITGLSSTDFRLRSNTRLQFDGKFKIGSDSSFTHDPVQDTTFFKGNAKQVGRIYQQSGTNAGRDFSNIFYLKSDAAYNEVGTSYNTPGTGQFNWYILNDQRGYGEDGFGIKNENLHSAFGPSSYTTLFTIRNNGQLELGYPYVSRMTRVNSDTFSVESSYGATPTVTNSSFYVVGKAATNRKTVSLSKFYIGADSTLKFDPANDLLQLSQMGTGTKEAGDLSKTQSNYIAGFATDGTVLDYRLARDTFIEDVTLFSVGTLMQSCQELTIVSSMTSLAPSNMEIRFPDAADNLRGKKIIVYSKKKDAGAFVPQIKVVGGVSRLYFTTNPAVGGTDPSDQSTLSIDDSTWSDHGTTFEFTCLKIDNTPSYRWVLKQR